MSHHAADLAGKLGMGGATVWATVSAIGADTVSAWSAVVLGAIFYGWGEWRKAKRAREQDALDAEARKAIHKLNMAAIHKKEPPPYPEFLPRPVAK